MFWHIVLASSDSMFFLIMLVMFLTGLIIAFLGFRETHNETYEQPVSRRRRSKITAGIGIMLFALAVSVLVASTYISNPFVRIVAVIAGAAPELLWIFYHLGASQRSSVHLSKHKNATQVQSKHKEVAQAQPKDEN